MRFFFTLLLAFVVIACTPAPKTTPVGKVVPIGYCGQNEPAPLVAFRTALVTRDYKTLAASFDPQSSVGVDWQKYFAGFDQDGRIFLGLSYAGTCTGGGRTISYYLQQVRHADDTVVANWTEIETSPQGLILDFNQG